MRVLVTGGAGYIGSHVVRVLRTRGDDVVVVDDLSTGLRERIGDSPLEVLDLSTDSAPAQLKSIFHSYATDAVVHLAAQKQVPESVAQPIRYYRSNLGGEANLLTAMQDAGVDRFVFSSSAAAYGMPDVDRVTEDTPPAPINPYGETKLVGEWLARAASVAWGLRVVNLRYFNVAGTGWPELADTAALNLVPIVFDRLTRGLSPQVYGDDYPTPDGTCIRDYVHVLDLAEAHVAALDHLENPERAHDTYNVGTGNGASVQEVLDQIRATTGLDFEVEVAARRAGDPASVVADVSRIQSELGWRATRGLAEIVDSAWAAWPGRPSGRA